jgi:Icc-related predicted phosphoesterase
MLGRRKPARGTAHSGQRWFFATDIHGSDRCFRKFLAAATTYEANVLVLGGDIAGKAIVPLTRTGHGQIEFAFHGGRQVVNEAQADAIKRSIESTGLYPRVCSPEEAERLADDSEFREDLFDAVIVEQVERWCHLVAERLPPAVTCVITPGNDDPFAIDAVLHAADRVQCPEGQLLHIGPVVLASLGNTNRTPWNTPREFDEDALAEQISRLLGGHVGPEPLVMNFHCPPYGSGLDTATKLDEELRPVVVAGATVEIPVGSTAVRDAVERYKPVVGLHGHIHESAGVWRCGRTVCLNPGSEYGSGVLKGALVQFDDSGRYRAHLLTTG